MAKKKADQTEQKEELTATESFFDKYKKFIFIGAGAIVVVIIGVVAYQKLVTEPFEEESQDVYWHAFYEWSANDSTDEAYTGTDDYPGFEEIADEYDGTPAGEIGNYAMAGKMMDDGDYEGALDYIDESDFDDVMIGTLVIGMSGDCYVELGQFEDAVAKFEEAAEREPNEFTTPMFLKKAGLVYEELNDREGAARVYQQIKDDWSESTQAQDIDKYIVRAQG